MLARANRITARQDFQSLARAGRRYASASIVLISRRTDADAPSRFGFIVSKAVGASVVRNRVKRRLRALAALELSTSATGTDVVVRALPGSGDVSWSSLRSEFSAAMTSRAVSS